MKKFAYLLMIASAIAFMGCRDDFDDDDSSSNNSSNSSSSNSSSSSSSSSTSDYLNTDPTTIDFSSDDISSNFTSQNTTTITFSSSGAEVSNQLSGDTIETNGSYVTIKSHGTGTIFKLTGSSSNGAIMITSDKKFELNLSGLTLSNPNGTAINIQNGHCFVVVDGSNTLSDASSSGYSDDYSEGAKSVFHSEDKLRFSGSGTLSVTASNAEGKHAMSSDDWIVVNGPTITAKSASNAGHGIKVNDGFYMKSGSVTASAAGAAKKAINSEAFVYVTDGIVNAFTSGATAYDSDDKEYKGCAAVKADGYVTISGGTVTAQSTGVGGKSISSDYIINIKGGTVNATATGNDTNSTIDVAPKAIKADGGILIEGGTITAKSSKHETIESKSFLKITDGVVNATGYDDAINSSGDMTISGGYVYAYSSGNDAIDANGNLYLQGGVVYAICASGGAEVAIDANTEGGYKLYVQEGCSLIAYGGLERGSSISQTCYQISGSVNSWYSLCNGSSVVAAFKPVKNGTYIVSTPSTTVYSGVTTSGTSIFEGYGYTSASGGSSVSLSSYNNGNSQGGGGGRGGW